MTLRRERFSSRTAFLVAWCFFTIATAIGFLLRMQTIQPTPGLNYAYFLHTHSHTAFLGWVYNAFFALAVQVFVPAAQRDGFRLLFVITQVAMIGMMLTFPVQGYALASILFSSLHVGSAAVFAWKLLRENCAAPVAKTALKWAFGFMLLSAVGPVALGPMAAADLRTSPWYTMAIYFYLHFQFNGWFMFFLKAVAFQRLHDRNVVGFETNAIWAVRWLAAGALLTVTLSAFWMELPRWVHAIGIVGGAVQLVGCFFLLRVVRTVRRALFDLSVARMLAGVAVGVFLLKNLLQFAAGWPVLVELAAQRMAIVGFIHLVFLGVVTAMLLAWAIELGWMRLRGIAVGGLVLLSAGTLITELVLFSEPLRGLSPAIPPWPHYFSTLMVAAGLMLTGVTLLFAGFRRRQSI